MPNCIVPGCKSEVYPGCGVSFHRFPKDEALLQKWVAALSLTKKLYKAAVVCSKHFTKKQYMPGYSRPTLRKDAIPAREYVIYNSDEDSDEDQDQGTLYERVPTIEPSGPTGHITIRQREFENEPSETPERHQSDEDQDQGTVFIRVPTVEPSGPRGHITIRQCEPESNSQSNPHIEEVYLVNEPAINPPKPLKRKMEDVSVQTGILRHPMLDELRHKIKVLQQRDQRNKETIKKLKSRLAMCKKHCGLLQAVGDDDEYEIVYIEES